MSSLEFPTWERVRRLKEGQIEGWKADVLMNCHSIIHGAFIGILIGMRSIESQCRH